MTSIKEWIPRVHEAIDKMAFPGFLSENDVYIPDEVGQLAFLLTSGEDRYILHNGVGKILGDIPDAEFERIRDRMSEMSLALGENRAAAQKESLFYRLSQATKVLRHVEDSGSSRYEITFQNNVLENWVLNSKTLTLCIFDAEQRRLEHIGNQDVVFDVFEVMSAKVTGVVAHVKTSAIEEDFDV